jgi:hypothetical protein
VQYGTDQTRHEASLLRGSDKPCIKQCVESAGELIRLLCAYGSMRTIKSLQDAPTPYVFLSMFVLLLFRVQQLTIAGDVNTAMISDNGVDYLTRKPKSIYWHHRIEGYQHAFHLTQEPKQRMKVLHGSTKQGRSEISEIRELTI